MRSRRSFSRQFRANTPENLYAKGQCALWLSQLVDSEYIVFNDDFFTCFDWAADGLERSMRQLAKALAELPDTEKRVLAAQKAVRSAMRESISGLDDVLASLLRDHAVVRAVMPEIIKKECRRSVRRGCGHKVFAQGRKQLRKIFGASKELAAVCEYLFILEAFPHVETYFEDFLGVGDIGGWRILAAILDMEETTLKQCLNKARELGLLQANSLQNPRLTDEVSTLWTSEGSEADHARLFCRPVEGKARPLDQYAIPKADVEHVIQLLSSNSSAPVHILLYGGPGTGKTSFAESLAAELKVKAWSVPSRDGDDDHDNDDRRSALRACLHMAAGHNGSFVLVDEADRMLDTGGVIGSFGMFFAGNHSTDKALLNALLEEPNRHVIWISNDVSHIDQAVRRRFSHSIHFEKLGLPQRKGIWRQILEEHGVAGCLPQARIDHFVIYGPALMSRKTCLWKLVRMLAYIRRQPVSAAP